MNRAGINSRIITAFTSETTENENIDILTRLPIQTYWTTNYDRLLEDGFRKNNRKVEVKIDKNQLAITLPDRDAVLYKMHGDVEYSSEAVLTKDDYESYDIKRPLFRTALQGDLISKTFLFVGFSFEDPNLDYILSRIHLLLGENEREHYCFFRNVKREACVSDDEFEYLKVKQELREKDLRRYGIQAVFVDEYDEITDVLRSIEKMVHMRNIFISGSAEEYEIAKAAGNVIIPLGSTGYVAKAILDEIKLDISNYSYLKKYVLQLEETKDVDAIVKLVLNIIDSVQ